MNKDKMELEEAIQSYKELKKHKESIKNIDTNFFFEFAETMVQALKETTEERNMYLRQLNRVFSNGFISKKKIEDKIKAYEKLIDDVSESEQYSHEIPLYRHDIQVLQELLEDK